MSVICVQLRQLSFSVCILAVLFCGICAEHTLAVPGDFDPSFGQGGITYTNFGSQPDIAYGVALQSDSKIVAVGITTQTLGQRVSRAAIARYNSDGNLDVTFADGGKTFHRFGTYDSRYTCVVIQPDGKIIAAGAVNFGTRLIPNMIP